MIRAVVAAACLTLIALPAQAQWTQGAPGRVWLKVSFLGQRTGEEFDQEGNRRERIDGGESDNRAIFTDVIVGILPSLDFWLQVPYLDLSFSNVVDTLRSTGIGDVRAWLRWQFLRGSTALALRAGAKAPFGFAPLDVQFVPIGEGQWDLDFFGEVGHSFWPFPAYWELWLGYRVRFEKATTQKDPGNEFVFLTEAGVNPTSRTLVKATLDGLIGGNWVVEGVETASARRILTLQLTGAARAVGPLWLEAGVRLPLAGQNFPAGPVLQLGASARFSEGS